MCTLKLGESTSTWKYFQVLILWKMRFRSTFKYTTSDFTGISKSSSVEKARLRLAFSKALGLGNAGKVLSLVFELLLAIIYSRWGCLSALHRIWQNELLNLVTLGRLLGMGGSSLHHPCLCSPTSASNSTLFLINKLLSAALTVRDLGTPTSEVGGKGAFLLLSLALRVKLFVFKSLSSNDRVERDTF